METISAQDLRNIIDEIIRGSINEYRVSKRKLITDDLYNNNVTNEEIDDFIFSNPYLDLELVEQLTNPGLLGFFSNYAKIYGDWKKEFSDKINAWVNNYSWLKSPELKFINYPNFTADENEIWIPELIIPTWLIQCPSYILIANQILKEGRYLSEMHWRDFEKLIGNLLESQGWKVEVTRGSKDGGIDIIALKHDTIIGEIKSIWQAKKYSTKNKVSLKDVRELSALRDSENATKGIIVTTSSLTKGAIDWISKDLYRLSYKEKNQIEEWVLAQKIYL